MENFGGLNIEDIRDKVISLCSGMSIPIREVYVSADFKERVYQVEVEAFKEYESLEDLIREEISIERGLEEAFGEDFFVNIITVEEEET